MWGGVSCLPLFPCWRKGATFSFAVWYSRSSATPHSILSFFTENSAYNFSLTSIEKEAAGARYISYILLFKTYPSMSLHLWIVRHKRRETATLCPRFGFIFYMDHNFIASVHYHGCTAQKSCLYQRFFFVQEEVSSRQCSSQVLKLAQVEAIHVYLPPYTSGLALSPSWGKPIP